MTTFYKADSILDPTGTGRARKAVPQVRTFTPCTEQNEDQTFTVTLPGGCSGDYASEAEALSAAAEALAIDGWTTNHSLAMEQAEHQAANRNGAH
jgi:hypothetical protein